MKHKKLKWLTGGLLSFGLINTALSLKWIKVKELRAGFKSLPENLSGLRILHITDIHNKSFRKMSLPIWKKIFKEDFDIAFITGDVTGRYFDQCLPLRKGLTRLAKQVPVIFVDGNHEKTHFKEMKAFLESCGVIVLDDKKITLDIGGGNLEILGTRDYYYQKHHRFKYFNRLMENEVRSGFRILLSHQPQIIHKLAYFKDIFVISGHTHGGQIRLPFLPVIYAPGQGFLPQYARGYYSVGGCKLYVSAGLGTSRIPIRFFNRPEITIITLEKEND